MVKRRDVSGSTQSEEGQKFRDGLATEYDEKFSKEENAPLVLSRPSLRNFTLDGKLVNYPLYAISLFPRFRLKITE